MELEDKSYIANHICYEGLDEIQRLFLAHKLNCHVALDGPPGVGKTQSILEISKVLNLKLFTKNCSTRTTESQIISFPTLSVKDGASVTSYTSGPLVRAMNEPGIFYGDEFNLLKEDVQKRLNSAFDDRAQIDRLDGAIIQAKTGFWGVISYNPSQSISSRDLEDSVADRFIHFHYQKWDSDFSAFISTNKAMLGLKKPNKAPSEKDFGIELQTRAISRDNFYVRFIHGGKIGWKNFYTGMEENIQPEFIYRIYDKTSIFKKIVSETERNKFLTELNSQCYSEKEFSRVLSRFTELIQSLSDTGNSSILKKIGLTDLHEKEDLELLVVHPASIRIETSALKHYYYLLENGFSKYLSQSYATRLVIDQICYGQYRDKKLRENTAYNLLNIIARSFRLFADNSKYNTKLISESLFKT
ncbi:MAG: MoxR family ATPase [Leptospiraceae bacterium]|nr:MoxR family ATPase [Leptospiraceae bacterium]